MGFFIFLCSSELIELLIELNSSIKFVFTFVINLNQFNIEFNLNYLARNKLYIYI